MAQSSTSFKPGKTGNPGGRPKEVAEMRALARERTSDAVDTLFSIMDDADKPAAARVAAANSLLDRGWGKLAQAITADMTATVETRGGLTPEIAALVALAAGGGSAEGAKNG